MAEPGHPVQLVRLDEGGNLTLDEETLSRCLEQGGVRDAPVCLVSVIGEQRRGKSFLLNCLMRQLQNAPSTDTAWMSNRNEVLSGFECRSGMASVTKGVWMWNQPFWVWAQGRRVAVFLVDTEGCLDLQRKTETGIKLSLFSILLSSYWIFNISNTFKQTEKDYLEVFVHTAEEVGETCDLPPVQRLDLLVRDGDTFEAYGAAGGQEYIKTLIQTLEGSAEQPRVLGALKATGTRCYVLPHPGTGFTKSTSGTLADTDEDFRQWLGDYVTSVVGSAGTHVQRDRAGQVLTRAQLAAKIKVFSRDLKTKRYDFSSPMKMAESLAAMRQRKENSRVVTAARKDYEEFVQQLDRDHQEMETCLSVEPAEMRRRLEGKRQELVQRCRGQLQGKEQQVQAALSELEEELERKKVHFLSAYERRFEDKKIRKQDLKMWKCAKGVAVGGAIAGAALGGGAALLLAGVVAKTVATGAVIGGVGGAVAGGLVGAAVGGTMPATQQAQAPGGRGREGKASQGVQRRSPSGKWDIWGEGKVTSTLGKGLSQPRAPAAPARREVFHKPDGVFW
ncbi:RING finger protein 112-like [Carettochelys insculpta]|uniref:RING finger protein 112-like n=1 Tax=Carettochelys insculpta TaxID=44489 RepID=UPI003EB736B8